MNELAIRVDKLSKRYRIGQGARMPYKTLRESLMGVLIAPVSWLCPKTQKQNTEEHIWALKDVSFEVNHGEVLGIIGRNGAGKSTLLKVLSRITEPTTGSVDLYGRVGSLLEVGTGFHPELTGRENIYLNGTILGMRRLEIEHKFDEIVAFAEIEKFIDTPVKFYSSGMYVRLAFAVAAHLEPEILLVDEVLAVGDAAFQKKCLGKMGEVAGEGRTVLFVSHNMGAVKSLCKTGIYLDRGAVQFYGNISKCIDSYLHADKVSHRSQIEFPEDPKLPIQLKAISVIDEDGNLLNQYPYDRPFWIKIFARVHNRVSRCYVALHVNDSNLDTILFSRDFEYRKELLQEREPGNYVYLVEVPGKVLVPGNYRISVHLAQSTPAHMIQRADYVCPFEILDDGSIRSEMGFPWYGKVGLPLKWIIAENNSTSGRSMY